MAQPVWVLSVDLQTKTAAFTSGMSDAARTARQTMNEIKGSSKEAGDGVLASSTNVRAGLGLIDNTIRGNHAAAMADLIREFQNTSLVMGLLPFAVVIGGIAAIAGIAVGVIAKYHEMKLEQEELRLEMIRFGTAADTTLNGLDDKLIQAQKQAAELKNNHLEAVRKELELIDHQKFDELIKSLDSFDKAADEVFKRLEGHMYTFGVGSAGAKHALDDFTVSYSSLVEQGKTGEAGNLLAGTLDSARQTLTVMQQMKQYHADWKENTVEMAAAATKLHDLTGRDSYTDKELQSQQALVATLEHQATAQQKIAAITDQQKNNTVKTESNRESGVGSERARQAAEAAQQIAEAQLSADKAFAMARLTIDRATIEQRLAVELSFASRDHDIKEQGNRAELAALDKAGKDYANQVAQNHNKAAELDAQYAASTAEMRARSSVEVAARDLQNFESGQRELIAATQEGSAERVAAIDSALRAEEARGLQQTEMYRHLGVERVATLRKEMDDIAKLQAEALKQEAEHDERMGQMALDALLQQAALQDSAIRVTDARREAEAVAAEQREFAVKQQAIQREQAALDASGKDYQNKLKALQNKEQEMTREHEDKLTAIRDQATVARNQRILAGENALNNALAEGITSMLMRHQSAAHMLGAIGDQIASGLMQNAIKSVLANKYQQESDASAAASAAFKSTMQAFPSPFNLVAAPLAGAAAFVKVMAFAGGTDSVPGIGRGDVTPAMLTPGEGVVPGGVMDGLRKVATAGGFDQRPVAHTHVAFSPVIHAIDGDGVRSMLNKHAGEFTRHFEGAVRRTNR